MNVQNKLKFVLSTLATVLVFASSAHAQEFMTQKDLLATIPGSTLYGISEQDGKTRWVQNYGKGRKSGKIAGLFGKEKYEAKWKVDGNAWCEDWVSGNGCWRLVRVDAKTLQPYKGTHKRKQVWKIK